MKWYDAIKSLFLILILLQFLPVMLQGIKQQYFELLEPKTKVGLVPISGVIQDSAPVVKNLRSLFTNDDIKAIVLRVNSSGGTAGSSQLIYDEIGALKNSYPKPVIAFVENVAASGAYWILCAADYTIAPGTAIVGSIGATFSYMFQLKEFIEQFKIKVEPIKAGDYKLATDPFDPINEQDRQMLQDILNDTYEQFKRAVAQSRKLSLTTAHEWANGKLFTAQQAHKLGLIDELGSASDVIKVVKEKAMIEGEIEWIKPSVRTGLLAQLFGTTASDDDKTMFTQCADAICSYAENRYTASVR